MSYSRATALQAALFASLSGDAELTMLVPGGVHDAPPPGTPQGTYVVLGAEEVIDRSDVSGPGAEHRVLISVLSDAAGFATAKAAAERVGAILSATPPALAQGRIVAIWFHTATARKDDAGNVRRVDLRFRVRIEA